jgi:hypothetical protein
MAKGSATPALTGERRDAFDGLVSLKIPAEEALNLISRAQGADTGEIMTNALRLRGGKSQLPPGGGPQPHGAVPVVPVMQAPPGPPPVAPTMPPAPPQSQPQMPGFGPPGGAQAAPTAQQLDPRSQFFQQYFGGPEPALPRFLRPLSQFFRPQAQPQASAGPPPAPVAQRPPAAPTPAQMIQPAPPTGAPPPTGAGMPMPAPVKPRVRVQAVGRKIPEAPTPMEAEQGRQEAAGIEETKPEKPKTQDLPLVASQEEYDKLPIGTRFKHPDGFIYRKESESGAQGPPQKLQEGGVVQPERNRPGEYPELPDVPEVGAPPPQFVSGGAGGDSRGTTGEWSTDTVPAELTPGEYVVPKPAVDAIGAERLDAMSKAAIPPTGGLPSGRTPVGITGQTVDASGHPVLRALAYGPNSEGATAADMRQIKGAFVDRLQNGDLAISPNLLGLYPPLSRVNVVDSKGNIVLPNARVADTSWISEGHPTSNTFEIYNGPSLGKGYHLVPI